MRKYNTPCLLALTLALLTLSCAELEGTNLKLQWVLPNKLQCAETSIDTMTIDVSQGSALENTSTCQAGEAPQVLDLGPFPFGLVEIEARAFDQQGELLFQAHHRIDLQSNRDITTLFLAPVN